MAAHPAVQKFYDDASNVISGIHATADKIMADQVGLKKTIDELNARPPGWGPEDQALVDKALEQLGTLGVHAKEIDDATEDLPQPPAPPV